MLVRAEYGELRNENAESETSDDDAIVEQEDLHESIGQEMRRRGLDEEVLRLQVHPSRLAIEPSQHAYARTLSRGLPDPGDAIREDSLLCIEDWLGFELIRLPENSPLSCGHNCGALCDFCTQMRPEVFVADEPDSWEQPCCRMRYHHILNNPIGGTRIPLDVHICHACLDDYVSLQIGGQYEPGYFTETEGNEVEEDFADDLSEDLDPDDDAYASSFERWFNLMRRNRRNRRATDRHSPSDDRDDVDGSENTASETNTGNLPAHGPPQNSDSDEDILDPEPDAKRSRLADDEAAVARPSSSSGSMPRLIDAAAAVPCAAANMLSLSSHPLYREEDTNDQQNEDGNRDNASASRRDGSSFQ